MATNFPSSADSFTNPTSGDTLDNPPHDQQHANINDAMEAVQASLLDGAPLHIDDANSRVGIGTTSPDSLLHLASTGSTYLRIEADTDNATETDRPMVEFAHDGGTIGGVIGVNDNQLTLASSVAFGAGIDFRIGTTNYSTVGADIIDNTTSAMYIKDNGNVGINDTSPSYQLDVDGDINATGDVRVAGNPVGMVLVKSQNIPNGSSGTVTVTNAFSSAHYNYRIMLSSMHATAVVPIRLTIGGQTAGYYWNRMNMFVNDATTISNSQNGYNVGYIEVGVAGTSRQGFASFDVFAPAVARRTGFGGTFYGSGYNGWMNGEHSSATAYTNFTLTLSGATFNGGEIYVYGYGG